MTDQATHPKLELSHTAMTEDEAPRFLDGHRIRVGTRTTDPKAQIVGEFLKSIRVPGYYPPLPELRQTPIASATSVTQLKEILGVIDLKLGDDATAELDRASAWKEVS